MRAAPCSDGFGPRNCTGSFRRARGVLSTCVRLIEAGRLDRRYVVSVLIGLVSGIITILSTSLAVVLWLRNRRLRMLTGRQLWLSSAQLDSIQRKAWADVNQYGGVIYESKFFSTNYDPDDEYALVDVSKNVQLSLTRILTLDTKNRREIARHLLLVASQLDQLRQSVKLYHNADLTATQLLIHPMLPEPVYNFFLLEPGGEARHKLFSKLVISWARTNTEKNIAGFEVYDEMIRKRIVDLHSRLIERCTIIESNDQIDHFARLHYSVVCQRFEDLYTNDPELYDNLAVAQLRTSGMAAQVAGLLKDNMQILDIGCGTGVLIEDLLRASSSVNVVGLDPSASMLDLARCRCSGSSKVDLQKVTFEDYAKNSNHGEFDLVVVTYPAFDLQLNLDAVERLARPGTGTILIVVNGIADDDISRAWPEPGVQKANERSKALLESGFELTTIDNKLDYANSPELAAVLERVFGRTILETNRGKLTQVIAFYSKNLPG